MNCTLKFVLDVIKIPEVSRKTVKELLQLEFPNMIEFHKRRKVKESESVKTARDTAIDDRYTKEDNYTSFQGLDYIYKAAAVIRKSTLKCGKWEFNGSFDFDKNVPEELSRFFHWVITGPATFEDVLKEEDVKARVNPLVNSTIYETYTRKQVKRRDTKQFSGSHSFLMPQQVATGIMIRQKHRDEDTINLLHRQGISVSYKLLLRLENRIANTVLERMISVRISSSLIHTFFAGDNLDFKEDIPDGKCTFHGAIVAVENEHRCSCRKQDSKRYQRIKA